MLKSVCLFSLLSPCDQQHFVHQRLLTLSPGLWLKKTNKTGPVYYLLLPFEKDKPVFTIRGWNSSNDAQSIKALSSLNILPRNVAASKAHRQHTQEFIEKNNQALYGQCFPHQQRDV